MEVGEIIDQNGDLLRRFGRQAARKQVWPIAEPVGRFQDAFPASSANEAPGLKARVTVHFETPAANATSEAVAFRAIFDPISFPFLSVSSPEKGVQKNAASAIFA